MNEDLIPALLPCPFCGSAAEYRWSFNAEWVECTNDKDCGVEVVAERLDDAIANWNRRTEGAAAPKPVQALSEQRLREALSALLDHCGDQGWWMEVHAVKVMDDARAALAHPEQGSVVREADG